MSRKVQLRQRDLKTLPPKATDIFERNMDYAYENTKEFLQHLLSNIEITYTKVGQSFDYPDGIIKTKNQPEYGNFINYFIRKHLSNQYHTDINDIAVEMVLKKPKIYFKYQDLKPRIPSHYKIFKDPQKNAMDILESIKIVSQAYSATYKKNYKIRRIIKIHSEDEMLLEIIQYFKSLPYKSVKLTPNLDCEYFRAIPDFIFDNGMEHVLYDIKISKYETLEGGADNFSKANFYIFIAYAFGYYKKTGRRIKTFRIYNPLLGCEHQIVINDIDFNEFERCLEKDIYGISKFEAMDIKKE